MSAIIAHARRLAEACPSLSRASIRRPSSASRAALPGPAEQFDQAPSLRLSRAEKRALDLLAGWPFCSPAQLAGLMDGVSERRANQVLHALRKHGLIQREDLGYLLSDAGLTYLARRDRAVVGPTLDRLDTRARRRGLHRLARADRCEPTPAPGRGHRVLRPAQRRSRPLPRPRAARPAAHPALADQLRAPVGPLPALPRRSFQLRAHGDWHSCLVEFERRAATLRRVPERLRAYRRYFRSGYVRPDHSRQLPLVLFVFETERAESTFLDTAEQVSPAPFLSSRRHP